MKQVSELFPHVRSWITIALVVATAVAAVGNFRVTSEMDGGPRTKAANASEELLRQVEEQFGDPSGGCLLVVEAGNAFNPATVAFVRNLTTDLKNVAGIKQILSLDDVVLFRPGPLPRKLIPPNGAPPLEFKQAEEIAIKHPLLIGQLISPDLKTQIIRLNIDRGLGPRERARMISEINEHLSNWREKSASTLPETPRLRLTGPIPIRVEALQSTSTESNRFMIAGVVLSIVIAIVIFRDFWAVTIVALPPLVAVFWTRGLMGWQQEPPNGLNSVILPVLVLMVGFTNAIHLMIDIRRSRSHGLDPVKSAQLAIEHLGPACFLTSLTTAIGLFSLVLADAEVIRRFAITSTYGVMFSFISVITIVPLLSTSWIGRHIHRGHERDIVHRYRSFFDHVIDIVTRRAGWFSVASIVITLLLSITVLGLYPDNRIGDEFPKNRTSMRALTHCDDVIGGVQTIMVLVRWPESDGLNEKTLDAIAKAQEIVKSEPLVSYPVSVLQVLEILPGNGPLIKRVGLLKLIPEPLRTRFVDMERRQAIITGQCRNLGIAAYEPVLARIENRLAELQKEYPGYSFTLTGSLVVGGRFMLKAIEDLSTSLALAAVIIFFVVTIVFRSIRIGLISVIPNAFPLVMTCALLYVSGLPLQITSVCAFTVCLGIAVDDTIHFLARYRREFVVDQDPAAASHRAFIAVGTAMITSTIILLVGFSAVLTSEIPSSQLFARLAITTIAAALVGDLIILPAMLVTFASRKHQTGGTDTGATPTEAVTSGTS